MIRAWPGRQASFAEHMWRSRLLQPRSLSCWSHAVSRYVNASISIGAISSSIILGPRHLHQPASAVAADTDVEAAISAAALAAGRMPGAAEQELAVRLKENWYPTAGEVAAMSREELDLMKVPVKLWAIIREQLDSDNSSHRQMQQDTTDIQQSVQPELTDIPETPSSIQAAVVLQQQLHDSLPEDIMQRRMPSMSAGGQQQPGGELANARGRLKPVRRVPLRNTEPYGLKDAEMNDGLHAELAALEKFSTMRFYGQLVPPLQPITFRTVTSFYVKLMLGYLHRVKGVPLDQLSLRALLPSSGREGVTVLLEYQRWREQERGTSPSSAPNTVKAMIHLARFLYHDQGQPTAGPKARPYENIDVMKELKAISRAAEKAALKASRVADDSMKWLEWDDYLAMVRTLRAECAGLTSTGTPRSRRAVAESLQRYLIVAILSVVPDRQRTLRELEVGRTLLRREDGTWVIKHGPGDYKTGKQYGDRPPMQIAPFIYPELEAFINTWRQELQPKTNKLFCKPRTGRPMTENDVYYNFKCAAVRLTGKATHPHLIRDMVVTHLRLKKTGEEKMEALALFMGHSVKIQRASYDRRTQAEKVKPAEELMLGLIRHHGGGSS